MKKVSTVLVENLKHLGVSHVFGIPGKPLVPLLAELESQDLQFVLTRHESGGGFAAAGYSFNKGLGVALGTSGPGGTNLLTAAGQAKAYHAPTLFITGHPSAKDTGKPQGQDSSMFGTDLVKMFEAVTLFSARVDRGDQMEMFLKHAIEKATIGIKGPVHLSIPMDVLQEEIPSFTVNTPRLPTTFVSNQLDDVVSSLNKAKQPVLLLGKGVHISNAYEEIRCFAEAWQIPVMTTPGGKGSFPTNHPLSLGAFGLGGDEKATTYLEKGIDQMIVVGSKLSDMSLAGFSEVLYPEHLIQFDVDPTFVQKSLPVPALYVQGDIKANLIELNQQSKVNEVIISERKLLEDHRGSTADFQENGKYLSAEIAIKELRKHLPKDTILFGDDGSHTFYAIKHYDIYQPGTFFFDDVFGAMGHAIGYAIGAKLASPETPIICLTGDGCTFMHGMEIATAVDQNLAVLFIVFNNYALDMVDKGMEKMLGHSIGASYHKGLDVQQFAESLGAAAFTCRKAEDIHCSIHQALENLHGPTVIEVMVDKEEIPPILNRV
ncbi:thiamine pyrophosphate-binding protein [Gracilibacillus caseinilyticus]|uniref:Thiamine pyrophosphate-binding protein n=1 Tax=Gracilibacillus caseinilyticus TaxID=2932256 RepID=A0ABY4EZH9_9BACI|nr:thiamine pyrophosphate-binding protein [Gracilibacillus caseinilyticus]UOQ49263.1 thiamine pyrophosphate-binding protein [Gracilibacillus caseinilyticus]